MADDASWIVPPRRALPEIVADRVVEAIRTGDLKPGERIVEATLAKRLGVSRGPLREALKVLEANHLVESHRGHGTRVVHIPPDEVLQMLVVRAVLEGLAARLVAARRTPAMVKTLTDLHHRITTAARAGRSQEWRDLDWQFHELICQLSGNDFLLRAWTSISTLVKLFLREHPGFEGKITAVLDNHARLLAALCEGTPDEADAIFRSVLLRSGHARLQTDIPPALAGLIDGSAEVLRILPRRARS